MYSVEQDDDSLFLEQRLSCRAPKPQEVQQMDQGEEDESLRRGRRVRRQVYTYRQEQEEVTNVQQTQVLLSLLSSGAKYGRQQQLVKKVDQRWQEEEEVTNVQQAQVLLSLLSFGAKYGRQHQLGNSIVYRNHKVCDG